MSTTDRKSEKKGENNMSHNKWIAMLLIAALAITAMSIAAFAETADSQPETATEDSITTQTEEAAA